MGIRQYNKEGEVIGQIAANPDYVEEAVERKWWKHRLYRSQMHTTIGRRIGVTAAYYRNKVERLVFQKDDKIEELVQEEAKSRRLAKELEDMKSKYERVKEAKEVVDDRLAYYKKKCQKIEEEKAGKKPRSRLSTFSGRQG